MPFLKRYHLEGRWHLFNCNLGFVSVPWLSRTVLQRPFLSFTSPYGTLGRHVPTLSSNWRRRVSKRFVKRILKQHKALQVARVKARAAQWAPFLERSGWVGDLLARGLAQCAHLDMAPASPAANLSCDRLSDYRKTLEDVTSPLHGAKKTKRRKKNEKHRFKWFQMIQFNRLYFKLRFNLFHEISMSFDRFHPGKQSPSTTQHMAKLHSNSSDEVKNTHTVRLVAMAPHHLTQQTRIRMNKHR